MKEHPPEVRRLARDEAGAVMVEYTVILSVVAVGSVLATIALGGPLVRMFIAHETWLLLPIP